MVLVFTNKEDVHPTPVIGSLRKQGVPVFRFNTEALLTDYRFCWWNNDCGCGFQLENNQNGCVINNENLTAVWDRRPETPKELPVESSEEINRYNRDEAYGFLRFLRYYLYRVPSIGSIACDGIAESKMLQLDIARSVGLKTPVTCFSNCKQDILEFASRYKYIALKVIESDSIYNVKENSQHVFYMQRVLSSSLKEIPEEAFYQTVSFAQEYVPKAFELRVTVVCDNVFACKIDSQCQAEETGQIDWRQGYEYGLKHEIYKLPKDVSNCCLRYLKQLRLNFGCFDFIVTPTGEYVFVECNPNGQWLWIENATGMEISKAIADALQHPEKLTNNSWE